jgi:hypothetical protein
LLNIADAMSKLPGDVTTLKALRIKLSLATSSAPSQALESVYRLANSAVAQESSALASITNAEKVVVQKPTDSFAILALGRDVISATSDAATANAYLSLDHTLIVSSCRVG